MHLACEIMCSAVEIKASQLMTRCLRAGSHSSVSQMETGTMLLSVSPLSTSLCTWTVLGCRVWTGSIAGWRTAQLDCLWLGASLGAMKLRLRYV